VRQAHRAGAAVLSGFNACTGENIDDSIAWARRLGEAWGEARVPVVHLEMGGYTHDLYRDAAIGGLRGTYSSIGMSHSEFVGITGASDDLGGAMTALARRLGVRRVCVHADDWAASATLDDPHAERDALMMGCLLASSRAAAGEPVRPPGAPPAATFQDPPFRAGTRRDGSWLVSCPAPHLRSPATTLGLGDTFMAGCLLVLGGRSMAQAGPDTASAERPRRAPMTANGANSQGECQ